MVYYCPQNGIIEGLQASLQQSVTLMRQCCACCCASKSSGSRCCEEGWCLCRWQSQERAQLLKVKKLRDRQGEMEDALIDLKVPTLVDTSCLQSHSSCRGVVKNPSGCPVGALH